MTKGFAYTGHHSPVHVWQFASFWLHQSFGSEQLEQAPQQHLPGTGPGDGAGTGDGEGGVGGVGGVGTGAGASPLHDGAGALASKVPVQISQFAAD